MEYWTKAIGEYLLQLDRFESDHTQFMKFVKTKVNPAIEKLKTAFGENPRISIYEYGDLANYDLIRKCGLEKPLSCFSFRLDRNNDIFLYVIAYSKNTDAGFMVSSYSFVRKDQTIFDPILDTYEVSGNLWDTVSDQRLVISTFADIFEVGINDICIDFIDKFCIFHNKRFDKASDSWEKVVDEYNTFLASNESPEIRYAKFQSEILTPALDMVKRQLEVRENVSLEVSTKYPMLRKDLVPNPAIIAKLVVGEKIEFQYLLSYKMVDERIRLISFCSRGFDWERRMNESGSKEEYFSYSAYKELDYTENVTVDDICNDFADKLSDMPPNGL